MKTHLLALLIGTLALASPAATTINPVNRFAYGANIGWINWRGDVANGAVIGAFVCSGLVWSANAGWINLGDGTPANGIRYQNNSATDFGVNHDGAGNLTGHAWGANIGWLTFTNRDANGAGYDGPKVDLLTGRLSGFIWSANCGWISLSNQFAHVQTDSMDCGPDTDGDGIPDAWEQFYFGNLTSANATTQSDADGVSDADEFLADTDPLNADSYLHITDYSATGNAADHMLTWTSRPTRLYRLRKADDVAAPLPWMDAGLGLFAPHPSNTTTRAFTDTASPQRFFRVEAVKPLAP